MWTRISAPQMPGRCNKVHDAVRIFSGVFQAKSSKSDWENSGADYADDSLFSGNLASNEGRCALNFFFYDFSEGYN